MKYGTISKAYAKSLYQLGTEQNVLVTEQLTTLNEAINSNNNFENVLFMDVFTIDEKIQVAEAVIVRLKLHRLIKSFLTFLIGEKRIHLFPLIFKEIVCMDDHEKGFLRGTLEGADSEMDKDFLKKITAYLEKRLSKKIHLDYIRKPDMLAGYRVTVEDFQLDASLDRQLDGLSKRII